MYKYINSIDAENKEAVMLLYGELGYELDGNAVAKEMQYLESEGIKKVTQRINSSGGSIINGLSAVSANLFTSMKVHTINDGIAASMAGIILMTGDSISATDYSLLMIHEPSFVGETIEKTTDTKRKNALIAFRDQLSIIIQNRSGKSKEEVDKIMNKETWYSASEAKEHGFVDNIIISDKKPKIKNEMSIDEMVCTITNFNKNNFTNHKTNKMEKLINHFNLAAEATIEEILAKVQEIEAKKEELSSEKDVLTAKLAEKENANTDLTAKVEVLEAEKTTLTDSKTEIENQLKEANDKLEVIRVKEITSYVENCIKDGKLKEEEKASLVETAINDFDKFKKIVDSMKVPHANILNLLDGKDTDPREDWKHSDWQKNDPKGLAEMKISDPEKEKKLYETEYKPKK